MNILGVAIGVILLLLAVFSLANWPLFSAPATLSFIVFDVQGSLGMTLLGVILILVGEMDDKIDHVLTRKAGET